MKHVFTALAVLMLAVLTVAFAGLGPTNGASAAECVDTDGDGYGWDGSATCNPDVATPICIDADGDGWGWDGSATCIPGQTVEPVDTQDPNQTTEGSVCVDADGDGWGWDGSATCIPGQTPVTQGTPAVNNGCANQGLTPGGGGQLLEIRDDGNEQNHNEDGGGVAQVADVILTANPWGANGLPGCDYVEWNVRHNGSATTAASNTGPCNASRLETASLNYLITDHIGDTARGVRAFPAMVLGSMFGRSSVTYGSATHPVANCWNAATLPGVQRDAGGGNLDLGQAAAATGFPIEANRLNSPTVVSVQADLDSANASKGRANVFLDTYWHDIGDPSKAANSSLTGINRINDNKTKVWNLNVWFGTPGERAEAGSWTGGVKVSELKLKDANNADLLFDVYVKVEGDADSNRLPTCRIGTGNGRLCFIYVALVVQDYEKVKSGIELDYTKVADWMKSWKFERIFDQPTFDDPNLTDIYGNNSSARPDLNANRQIANAIWGRIDGGSDEIGPAFPGQGQYAIGGLHLGSELWFNPNSTEATIDFGALGFKTEKGTFGLYKDF